jgi:hypothetical protein
MSGPEVKDDRARTTGPAAGAVRHASRAFFAAMISSAIANGTAS